jgi:hypothetical protein
MHKNQKSYLIVNVITNEHVKLKYEINLSKQLQNAQGSNIERNHTTFIHYPLAYLKLCSKQLLVFIIFGNMKVLH